MNGSSDSGVMSCPLLSLPPLPFECIWNQLQDADKHNNPVTSHQHALRCTCKAMRRASTSLISSLRLNFIWPHGFFDNTQSHAERQGAHGLATFPSDAKLTSLMWAVTSDEQSGMHDPMSTCEVLSTMLWRFPHTLASLQRLQVSLGVNEKDLATLALMCPQLKQLELETIQVVGDTLMPLCKLSGLQSLSLTQMQDLDALGDLQRGLAPLTQLTSLSFAVWPEWGNDYDPPTRSVLQKYDSDVVLLMSTVATLRGLKELSMQVRLSDSNAVDCLHQLSSMAALTSLTMDNLAAENPEVAIKALLPYLTPLQQLARLHLPELTLNKAGMRALAALPLLADIQFGRCAVDSDASQLPCRWRRVTFEQELTYKQLAWLPLGSTTRLRHAVNYGQRTESGALMYGPEYHWALGHGGEDVDSTCRLLERVAQILVRLEQVMYNLELTLLLRRAPLFPAPRILQALAPLNGRWLEGVTLKGGWTVDASLAQALALHLPNLRRLKVIAEGPGFPDFVQGLRNCMPSIGVLGITLPDATAEGAAEVQLSEAACSALLDLLTAEGSTPRIDLFQPQLPPERGTGWQALYDRARECGLGHRVHLYL